MYAVIKTSGKQHRVSVGDYFNIDIQDVAVGAKLEFNEVLMLQDGHSLQIGTPTLPGVKVVASVLTHGRDKKVKILKFKRRKHHMKSMGHRQWFTKVKIESIDLV